VIELLDVVNRERFNVDQLVSDAERMAERRRSSRLGLRHLLMAAGVAWRDESRLRSVSVGVARETGQPAPGESGDG
jgi:hypothetical protein